MAARRENEKYIDAHERSSDVVVQAYERSAVLTTDTQVKASGGLLHSLTFACNDAAPTAGSIIVYDSLSEAGTQVFNHTFTTTPFLPFTLVLDYVMETGIYVGFTTTNDVNVVVAYL
jgi:ABC-type phosphate/phosphonate transport system substrate-binding protein